MFSDLSPSRVFSTISLIDQYRKSDISKAGAILVIQAALSSEQRIEEAIPQCLMKSIPLIEQFGYHHPQSTESRSNQTSLADRIGEKIEVVRSNVSTTADSGDVEKDESRKRRRSFVNEDIFHWRTAVWHSRLSL